MAPGIIVLIIIFGIAGGIFIAFIVKTIIAPKQLASISDLIRQGKPQQAVKTLKQILSKDQRNIEAHYLLGKAYVADNKPELGLMEYKTVNEISSFGGLCPEVEFRNSIADLFMHFQNHEEALKEYLLLIKIQPSEANYYYKIGCLFLERHRTDKAAEYFKKTIEIDSRHTDAYFQTGLIMYQNKRPVEAKDNLEKALKLSPSNYKACFYLGKLLKESREYVAALLMLEKAQKDPNVKVKALVERGSCYMSMNNFEKASGELERAIKLTKEPSSSESLFAHYFLSICYEKARMIEKAIEEWEFIYQKKPAFRNVAEKLSQYQDLRTDDRVKDYLTSGEESYKQLCSSVVEAMNLSVRDIDMTHNGCRIIAVESESGKWLNARKMPRLIHFLRIPDTVDESTVRKIQDEMKQLNVPRAIIVSSSNFSRNAVEYAENRPINLFFPEKLQELLKFIDTTRI